MQVFILHIKEEVFSTNTVSLFIKSLIQDLPIVDKSKIIKYLYIFILLFMLSLESHTVDFHTNHTESRGSVKTKRHTSSFEFMRGTTSIKKSSMNV